MVTILLYKTIKSREVWVGWLSFITLAIDFTLAGALVAFLRAAQ